MLLKALYVFSLKRGLAYDLISVFYTVLNAELNPSGTSVVGDRTL